MSYIQQLFSQEAKYSEFHECMSGIATYSQVGDALESIIQREVSGKHADLQLALMGEVSIP